MSFPHFRKACLNATALVTIAQCSKHHQDIMFRRNGVQLADADYSALESRVVAHHINEHGKLPDKLY